MKRCSKCGVTQALENFGRDKNAKDGLSYWCKACAIESSRRYRAQNREKVLVSVRRYTEAHREELREYSRRYYSEHREERLQYYRDNKERYAQRGKEWLRKNPDKARAKQEKYRKSHPGLDKKWRLANPDKARAIKAKRRAANGPSFTHSEWRQLKERYGYKCLCCGRAEPEISLEADHVIPLARGGTNTIQNIQPLCRSCNRRKATKSLDYRVHKLDV